MNTPDQLDALRVHLDEVLAGAGDGLPSRAAPALLRTARRRTRTKRIVGTVGSLAVVALVAVGVSSVVTSSAKPSVLSPAGPYPPVPQRIGLRITHRASNPTSLATGKSTGQFIGTKQVIVGPNAGTASEKTSGTLSLEDLTTGKVRTVATNLAAPLGVSVALGGDTAYLVQGDAGKAVISEYDVTTGARLGDIPLPSPSLAACGHPINSCVHAQVDSTSLGLVAGNLMVSTPSGDDTITALLVIDPASGKQLVATTVQYQNVEFVAAQGALGYFTAPGEIFSVDWDGRGLGIIDGQTGSPNAGVVVGNNGVYVTNADNTGGPDPSRPTTFTLRRLDPKTLGVTKTITEKVPGTSTAAQSAATIGASLYTTLGDCPTAPTTDVCIQQRDPVTLAITGTALRFTPPNGSFTNLAESVDGIAAVTVNGSGGTTGAQVDLLANH